MTRSLLVLILFCFSFVFSLQWPEWEDHSLAFEKGWRMDHIASLDASLEFTIGLRLRNTDLLSSLLEEVSNPMSPKYGQYYTQQQIFDLIKPPQHHIDAVISWIKAQQIETFEILSQGGFIRVSTTVRKASILFNLHQEPFQVFRHKSNPQKSVIRTASAINIPPTLHSIIDLIADVNDFPYLQIKPDVWDTMEDNHLNYSFSVIAGDGAALVNVLVNGTMYNSVNIVLQQDGAPTRNLTLSVAEINRASVSQLFNSLANYVNLNIQVRVRSSSTGVWTDYISYGSTIFPSAWITTDVVNRMYFIPPTTAATNKNNSQAVVEFDGQYYSPSDLSQFSQLMGLPEPLVTVVGTNDPSKPRGESTLDIEWITAVGVNVPTVFWSVDKGFLLAWAIQVENDPNPPYVFSISYGSPEQYQLISHTNRLNQQFQMFGLRGITIISTSGDIGTSDGTNLCTKDIPDFPSSSPYTTSLGATYVYRSTDIPFCTGQSVAGIPIVCEALAELPCSASAGSGFTTGGGFSNRFSRPSYQDQAVIDYLSTVQPLPPSNYFNSSGRGFNDVGALGYNILVVQSGEVGISGGTSASGPIFGGIVGLLNDARLNLGKSPLGFINPWLYQLSTNTTTAFNQVLSGDNRCEEVGSNGESTCCTYGFYAQKGWNPLTGLGTPVFSVLLESAISLQ